MKKIVSTGPESSGKTTLTEALSLHLNLPFVSEMARVYLHERNGRYTMSDLQQIAVLQAAMEDKLAADHPEYLLCDTDLLTILIWMEDKFNCIDQEILSAWLGRPADLYLLCYPDFPWQFDPQREDEQRREEIFEKYLHWLRQYQCPFIILKGNVNSRINQVIKSL